MFQHNNEGRNVLLKEYDQEELQAIADHGCTSGVCFKHIYYGDTIAFFDKHEAEILDLIHVRYGVDELVSIFKRSDADYDMYRNECCWLFIENVASDVMQSLENEQLSEDEQIENYMTDLNKSADDLMNLSVYNPPNSMTLHRYSQC